MAGRSSNRLHDRLPDALTREQIEYIQCVARAYMDDTDRTKLDILCDMALRSLETRALVEAGVREMKEEAERSVCPRCERGEPVHQEYPYGEVHVAGTERFICSATAIRDLDESAIVSRVLGAAAQKDGK